MIRFRYNLQGGEGGSWVVCSDALLAYRAAYRGVRAHLMDFRAFFSKVPNLDISER